MSTPSTMSEGVQQEILASTGGVLYDAVGINAAGETIEFVMPDSFHTCTVIITVQGDDDTDAASWAERMANVTAVQMFTTEGEALRVEGGAGADPFNYAEFVTAGKSRSYAVGGDAANEEDVINYVIPFSLDVWNWFNYAGEFYGVPLQIADRLRVTFAADATVGMDSRAATIQAFGLRKPTPKAFRTTIVDAYTAVIGQSHWSELPSDSRLAGVWTFHTSSWNSDVATTVLSVSEQRLAYGRTSFFKRVKTIALQDRVGFALTPDPAVESDEPTDCYTYWHLDPNQIGAGEPNPGNLVIESVGGIAEATRVYPVVWRIA